MKIKSIEFLPAPYSFESDPFAARGRTPESAESVSVSTVKDYLAHRHGFNNYDVNFASEDMKLKAWMGLAFEDRMALDLARTHPDLVSWPGELWTPNGKVMGHPEGFYPAQVTEHGVFEFKHTYTSASHYDNESSWDNAEEGMAWHYLFQLKSYVAMAHLSGVDCREGWLIVLANMGNYKDRRGPELPSIKMEFSQRELEDQVRILEKSADRAWTWKQEQQA